MVLGEKREKGGRGREGGRESKRRKGTVELVSDGILVAMVPQLYKNSIDHNGVH